MESTFGPVPLNHVHIEPSFFQKNWPHLNILSDVNFTVNSPLVPCLSSSVNVKPTRVKKLFCDHLNLTCELVKNVPSGPLTIIIKGPQYAVTHNFANSIQTDMDFRHCLSPYCFLAQVVTSFMGFSIKRTVVHFPSYGNRRRRFFRFIEQRNQMVVYFYFIHRYSLLRTLLSLP